MSARLQSVVNETSRRYPRGQREAFPQEHEPSAIGIEGPVTKPGLIDLQEAMRGMSMDPLEEYPPAARKTLVIAVLIVALAVWVSSIQPWAWF